jgi:hypothetical protein
MMNTKNAEEEKEGRSRRTDRKQAAGRDRGSSKEVASAASGGADAQRQLTGEEKMARVRVRWGRRRTIAHYIGAGLSGP